MITTDVFKFDFCCRIFPIFLLFFYRSLKRFILFHSLSPILSKWTILFKRQFWNKYLSKIMILCLDSNPWPLNHEASPTMTKAYAPLYLFLIPFSFSLFALFLCLWFWIKNCHWKHRDTEHPFWDFSILTFCTFQRKNCTRKSSFETDWVPLWK